MKNVKPSETIGDRIKRSREDLELTQRELAAAVGVSRVAVAQWESGDTKNLKNENLFAVARKLKKSPEWLATGKGSEVLPPNVVAMLEDLPDSYAQSVLDMMELGFSKVDVMASDTDGHYMDMLASIRRDMAERLKRPKE